ncbi:DUF1194 domain-containing protein [Myxosarcina sp. GI1(2024)]
MFNKGKVTALLSPLVVGSLLSSPVLAFGVDFSGDNDTVDKVILLQSDVSSSVDAAEFNTIRSGYANAFINNTDLHDAIASYDNGIVFGFQYWSTTPANMITDGSDNKWFLLQTPQDAIDFGNLILSTSRPFDGGTNIGAALNRGAAELGTLFGSPSSYKIGSQTSSGSNTQGTIENVVYETIIDIAGDGIQDRRTLDGTDNGCDGKTQDELPNYVPCNSLLVNAKANALLQADRINGLPIFEEASPDDFRLTVVDEYYQDGE